MGWPSCLAALMALGFKFSKLAASHPTRRQGGPVSEVKPTFAPAELAAEVPICLLGCCAVRVTKSGMPSPIGKHRALARGAKLR